MVSMEWDNSMDVSNTEPIDVSMLYDESTNKEYLQMDIINDVAGTDKYNYTNSVERIDPATTIRCSPVDIVDIGQEKSAEAFANDSGKYSKSVKASDINCLLNLS